MKALLALWKILYHEFNVGGIIAGIFLMVVVSVCLYQICYPYSRLRVNSFKGEVDKEIKKLDKVLLKFEKYKNSELYKKFDDDISSISKKTELIKGEFNTKDEISDLKIHKSLLDDYYTKLKVLNLEASDILRKIKKS